MVRVKWKVEQAVMIFISRDVCFPEHRLYEISDFSNGGRWYSGESLNELRSSAEELHGRISASIIGLIMDSGHYFASGIPGLRKATSQPDPLAKGTMDQCQAL